MNSWDLQTEILGVSHRWYWVVASFLLGALLGCLVSFVWPAPYQAVQDIYVGLNAYRTTRDLFIAQVAEEQFRNLDDYKNWQMGQLNSLALSDEYLAETLTRLQFANQDWQDLDLPGLRTMLTITWRNTGDWHFSAQADQPYLATQVVLVWSQVVIEKVAIAVDSARHMIMIDSKMQAVSSELVNLQQRQILLQETLGALSTWQNTLETEPSDQSLSISMHWALLSQVTNASGLSFGWLSALDTAPLSGSLPDDYIDWLIQVDALIEAELFILPTQIDSLTGEQATLAAEYNRAADDSQALSANLEVRQLKSEPPQVESLRPTGNLVLIGGMLGIIAWGFFWLVQITRRTG